ncbi:uncharacterized protein LOC143244900 [Tachypleus tridentatus]|uniref:uncharacterized protein LOC143244900 n=1 Tax=Tachypleus tridentatus TaxID=6853 RepID=UPI003FD59797
MSVVTCQEIASFMQAKESLDLQAILPFLIDINHDDAGFDNFLFPFLYCAHVFSLLKHLYLSHYFYALISQLRHHFTCTVFPSNELCPSGNDVTDQNLPALVSSSVLNMG